MRRSDRLPFSHPANYISTWFGVGYCPIAPGTAGSIAAVPIAWGIHQLAGPYGSGVLFVAAVVVFFVGLWASHVYAATTGGGDPKEVVVDEVAGQWLALVFVLPDQLWMFAVGFVLFRFFDIVKPWPVNWADRHLPGGWGIMLDDVVAGIYAGIVMYGLVIAMESEYVLDLARTYL